MGKFGAVSTDFLIERKCISSEKKRTKNSRD